MRSQSKAILVGGLLVFLGYVLGSAANDGSAYAQSRSSSAGWAGVSVPDGGGAVIFRESSMSTADVMVWFVDSKGTKRNVR